jgi:hypothetical protein
MPDLTTLEAVKQWLAIPDAQTGSDAQLATLITATSADFLRALERTDFLSTTYTEVREGDGGKRLVLRHWPITVVASVNVGGNAITAQVTPGGAGFYVDWVLDPERLNELYLNGSVFTDAAPVIIAYTAGYVTAPADVAQAVVEWVAARYKSRTAQGVSAQREAGGEHVTFDKDEAMPANTARVVERYKRCWPSLDKRQDDRDYRVTRINRTTTETVKA